MAEPEAPERPTVLPLEFRMSLNVVLQRPAIIGGPANIYVFANFAGNVSLPEKVVILQRVMAHIEGMLEIQGQEPPGLITP